MTMTYNQFVECALDLKTRSDSIDDGWHFREHTDPMTKSTIKYLVKKDIREMNVPLNSSYNSEVQMEEDCPILCQYHILFNPSYSCPDMFFNMSYNDGNLLTLEQVLSLVHSSVKQNVIADKWNAITQKEHPVNGIPFFRIHPCKTNHMFEVLGLYSKTTFEFNPLITWLSTISPLICLELPLSYGHKNIVHT